MSEIVLQGVGPNAPPGIYGTINFAAGPGSAGSTTYGILLIGDMTTGTASPATVYGQNTPVICQSATDAGNLFGFDSPLANMFVDQIGVNPALQISCMATTPNGVAASTTFTITTSGTQTTGVIRFTLGTTAIDTEFGAADSTSTIATNIANNINGNTTLLFSAVASTDTVVVTATTEGDRTNNYRVGAQVLSGGGVLVNKPSQSPTLYTGRFNLSGGSGSNKTSYDTCINNLVAAGLRYYTIVPEAGGDSFDGYNISNTGNLIIEDLAANLIDLQAEPTNGVRQFLICGSVDTLGNTTAVSTSLNDPRLEIINLTNSDLPPCRLAAQWAAAKVTFQVPFLQASGVNWDNFGATPLTQSYWNVPAPLDGSSPSQTNKQVAVVSGVTLVQALSGGRTKVVKSCTTHFWVGTAAQFDPRIVDSGKVTICDYVLDDVESALAMGFSGGQLVGTEPGPGVVTVADVTQVVTGVLKNYRNLIDLDNTLNGLVVQLSTITAGRIEIQIPLFTDDPLHTFVVQVNQVQ